MHPGTAPDNKWAFVHGPGTWEEREQPCLLWLDVAGLNLGTPEDLNPFVYV
jgi:hypothetical protein